jgi:hypothetical protein
MAYNQFTLQRCQADFGLTLNSVPDLFPGVPPVPLPARLREQLPAAAEWALAVSTEAARSQLLIAPLLFEVWRAGGHRVALYAGTRFDVDEAAGLTGVCDFILSRPPQLPFVTAPVMMIVEAKNEDIWGGAGQCAAAMVAARRFNAARVPPAGDPVYGAVTDGERWRFLRLQESVLDIDLMPRLWPNTDQIFGILLHIVGIVPAAPAAA